MNYNELLDEITEPVLDERYWEGNSRGHLLDDLTEHLNEHTPYRDDEIEEIANTSAIIVELIAQSHREREYTINNTTYTLLAHGHKPIMDRAPDWIVDLADKLELISRPRVYGNDKQRRGRQQIARKSYYDLGQNAQQYLDMQYVRGLDENSEYPRGDRNEGIAHAVGVELAAAQWSAEDGVETATYVTLPHHVDEDHQGRVYDVVAFRKRDNMVLATIEVETQTDDSRHVTRDAEKLAVAPGESVWVTPNKASQNQLLRTLQGAGMISPEGSNFPHALSSPAANEIIDDAIQSINYKVGYGHPPINRIATYNGLRRELKSSQSEALHAGV